MYINNMASNLESSRNSTPFWDFVKLKHDGTNNLVSLNVNDAVCWRITVLHGSSLNLYFSSVVTVEDLANLTSLESTVSEKLDFISCCSGEVKKHLQSLKMNKSPRPDRISLVDFKAMYKSFQMGLLPEDWRAVDIVPIHKRGSKHLRENYHPISFTSIVCKISEKIVSDRILSAS